MSSVDGKIVTAPAFEKDEDYFSYMYLCKDGNWHYIGRNVRSYDEGWNTTQEWCDNFIEDFSSGKDGEIRKGDITGLDYKYDEKMGKWRRIDSRDALFSTVCTLNHVGELIENVIDTLTSIHKTYFDTVTYVCDENGWRKIAVRKKILEQRVPIKIEDCANNLAIPSFVATRAGGEKQIMGLMLLKRM